MVSLMGNRKGTKSGSPNVYECIFIYKILTEFLPTYLLYIIWKTRMILCVKSKQNDYSLRDKPKDILRVTRLI